MTSNRRYYFCFLLLVGLLVATGVVHGLWTDRWAGLHAAELPAADLERIPLTVGAWEGKRIEQSPNTVPLADLPNTALYRYVNQTDGSVVSVLLSRGRPGPMVIKHLPTE